MTFESIANQQQGAPRAPVGPGQGHDFLDLSRVHRDLPAGDAFDAWRLKALSRAEFQDLGDSGVRLSRSQLAYLASAGLLAPTYRNTVPQRFRLLDGGGMEVWIDRRVILPISDGEGRQAVVSVGCAIANVAMAARCYGLQATVELASLPPEAMLPARPGHPSLTRLARVSFEAGAGEAPGWIEAMLLRKVVRAEYDGEPLEPSLSQRLRSLAGYRHGLALHLVSDAPTLCLLGRLDVAAESILFPKGGYAAELGEWLLPNDHNSPLGMRGRELGLSDEAAEQLHLALVEHGPRRSALISRMLTASDPMMQSASAVGILTVPRDDLARRIAAGRAYEEIAVLLSREGYATSVHCAMTDLAAPRLALKSRLGTGERPAVIFRIGRPLQAEDGRRPHSARPLLEYVLLRDEVQ